MKTICLVTDTWEPELSGVVNTLRQTLSCLKTRGFEVDLIEPSQFRRIDANFLAPGLRFALPPYGMDRLSKADAIHIATEGPLGWAAKIFCDHRGIVYSTAYHTNFPEYMKWNWRVPPAATYAYLKKFHANSAAVMAPTKTILTDLEAHGFKNCVLWGRGVDKTVFNTLDEENVPIIYPGPEAYGESWQMIFPRPYFLSVGRLSKEKNLDAFLKLDLPGTKVVVGEGPDENRLRKTYAPYGNVLFFGKKTGKELASMYRAADVFVFPSWFDTFGLVNIESISCGTPVAAFPAPGPIDIIEQGITGVCDPDLGAACLAALNMGEFSGEFSWETATRQFVNHLQFR